MNLNEIPLEQQGFAREMRMPHYRYALRNNMTRAFMRQPLLNKKGQLNSIVSIYGKTGSGKSIISWLFGEWNGHAYGYDMTADRVHFDMTGFSNALERSDAGDMLIMDEQVEVFGEGSIQVQKHISNIEMTVREGEVSMAYVGPELRLHCHHYVIRPAVKLYGLPRYKGCNNVLSWVFDGLKDTAHPNKPIGYIVTGLPKGTKVDKEAKDHKDRMIWPEEYLRYKKKKHDFISRVKKGEVSSGSGEVVKKLAESFIRKYEDELPDIRSKKEALAMMNLDDDFKRNLTVGQKDQIVEVIKLICKLEDKDCGMVR